MRPLNYFGIGLLLCLLFTACSSGSKNHGSQLTEMSKEELAAGQPIRMQSSNAEEHFTLKGKAFTSNVVRQPDEALPLVTNAEGEQFVDNRISLHITSQGRTVVHRVFTKQDFSQLLNARFMKYAILEGLVFDQVTEAGTIRYAASVAYPQSDLYVPLRITVTPNGQLSIEREEIMDEAPQEQHEEKER